MKKVACLLLCLLLLLSGCSIGKRKTYLPAISVYEPDYMTLPDTEPTDPEQVLAWRRDKVEQMMRYICSIRWTVDEDVTYSYAGTMKDEKTVIKLKAGRVYQGMPYTHGGGSAYSWLSFATEQDENGVYHLSGITKKLLHGSTLSRIGNDCADAVFWAWSHISSSITFKNTVHMTEQYGCLKVGDYECNYPSFSSSTVPVCEQNGQQRMFAAYAQLQKADAMVHIEDADGGHAVMITEVHVEYDGDEIDGKNSYVKILDQGPVAEIEQLSKYDPELDERVYLCEMVDKKRSFNEIYQTGYLPVTCKELIDPSPREEVRIEDPATELTAENMFKQRITATYRISSVTVNITDAKGNLVQTATCFGQQREMYSLNLQHFTSGFEEELMLGKVDIDQLPKGSYNCTFTCRVSTGDSIQFRNFDFTIS